MDIEFEVRYVSPFVAIHELTSLHEGHVRRKFGVFLLRCATVLKPKAFLPFGALKHRITPLIITRSLSTSDRRSLVQDGDVWACIRLCCRRRHGSYDRACGDSSVLSSVRQVRTLMGITLLQVQHRSLLRLSAAIQAPSSLALQR